MAFVVINKNNRTTVIAKNMEVVAEITGIKRNTVNNTFSSLKADEFETIDWRVVKTIAIGKAGAKQLFKAYEQTPKTRKLVKVGRGENL